MFIRKGILALFFVPLFILSIFIFAPLNHSSLARALSLDATPGLMNYQGYLTDNSQQPINGDVSMTFGIYANNSGGPTLWSETIGNVPVADGYFSVVLGKIDPLDSNDFNNPDRYLQVTVNSGLGGAPVVLPRQQLTSVPYAFRADTADFAPWSGLTGIPSGFSDGVDDIEFQNVVVVAKSGGHFHSIQEAIDSILDAGSVNRYLIWIAPGVYDEVVTLKPFVDLQGAGQSITRIQSDIGNNNYPPTAGTVNLAQNSSIRDVTVENFGTGAFNVGIFGPNNSADVSLIDVVARADGGGESNYGTLLIDGDYVVGEPNTNVRLVNLDSSASSGNNANIGLEVALQAEARAHGGIFNGEGGSCALGISVHDQAHLEADDATATGAKSDGCNLGMIVNIGSWAGVRGGSFRAEGGSATDSWSIGIGVFDPDSYLEASAVYALAINNPLLNTALALNDGAEIKVHGGSFTASGGGESYGIVHYGGILQVSNADLLGEGNDSSYGLGLMSTSTTVNVANSQLSGSTGSISLESSGQGYLVANSRLNGTVNQGSVGGVVYCLGVTSGLNFYADTCPIAGP